MRMNVLFLLIGLLLSCSSAHVSDPSSETRQQTMAVASVSLSREDLPKIGFNCKASYNIVQQTKYADLLFAQLDSAVLDNMVLRIPGGTRSQKDFTADWPDEKMKLWTSLQQKYGYSMVYVVNGNDTPKNQLAIIRRWQENGARFEFLEMMTEYYLPKFSKPDLTKPEVTRRVDAKIYTEEILPAFYHELDSIGLPYFLIFAPAKKNKVGAYRYAGWNEHMVEYVKNHQGPQEFGAVLHLYQKNYKESYDFEQIDRLRSTLPEQMSIAVTELGVLDRSVPWSDHPALTVKHMEGVMAELGANDYVMDQVLYHDYERNPMADTHPRYTGISPKGKAVVAFYNSLFD